MAVYRHPDVLDFGLDRIKTAAKSIALVDYAYVQGDSYATVRGTADANIIAEATVTSASFTLADHGTLGRKVSSVALTPTAVKTSSGAAGQLKFVIFDTVNTKVLAVIDEITDQVITLGNQVQIPVLVIADNQPVEA